MAERRGRPVSSTSSTAGPFPGRPGGGGGHWAGLGEKQKAKDARGTLFRLLRYLGRKRAKVLVVFGATTAATVLTLVTTRMNGALLDTAIVQKDLRALGAACLLLLLLYVLNIASNLASQYLMIDVAQDTVKALRRDLFAHLQRLPVRFFDRSTHGDLMSRFTNDIENVSQTLSMSVSQFFGNSLMLVGVLVAMLLLNPPMALVSIAAGILSVVVTRLGVKYSRRFYKLQQSTLGELNGYIEETLTGQRVVKVFNREEAVKRDFAEVNGRLRAAGLKSQILTGVLGPFMNMVNNIGYAAVTLFGAWMCLNGSGATVGMVFAFLLYQRQFSRPVNEILNLFATLQSALAGAERVFGVLDEAPEPADAPDAADLRTVAGLVAADDVTFSYLPGRPVLKNASFVAEPGATIALVGPTGAGKTTVVSLLTRFYDVDSGSLSIDGIDLRRVRRDRLRASLGIVLQDTVLFSETVRENIRFGRLGATDAEVEAAARTANADPFIRRLPQGYDTVLSDDGGNLSQGQRQLLSIARAVLSDPAILILDEATSSVDTRTEIHIQQAMLELMKGRTSFVIAHRLSTIRNADLILVVKDGEIVERGTHEALMATDGYYATLQNAQRRTGLGI